MCLFGVESCRDAIQVIDTFASIMTIIGVTLAIYIAARWKTQENYSFIRDKIFELELAASELYNQEIYYIVTFKDIAIEKKNGTYSEEYFFTEIKYRLTKLQECLKEYDIKLSGLQVLDVKYDKKLLEPAGSVHSYFEEIIKKVKATHDRNKIIDDFDKIYLIQANNAKHFVLEHLKSLRNSV